MSERSEVDCIRPAPEMLDLLDADGKPYEAPARLAKLDANLVRALRLAPDGLHDVTVLLRGGVDVEMLKGAELNPVGRMPGGGLIASGVLAAPVIEELAARSDVVAIESNKTEKLLNDQKFKGNNEKE